MGKVQSKHGDCIVVNAHFNPVCQLDDDLQRQKPQAQTFACSELSLSLCDDESCKPSESFEEEKCPLHEEEGSVGSTEKGTTPSVTEDEERPEKAEEERSEKEEKGEGLAPEVSCNMSLQGEEKQEFSFTLYDFNGHGKVTKDDIASLVRSIYDALGKKSLPKSGSRTIKVRLAIGPDEESGEGKLPAPEKPPPSSRNSSATTACTLLTDDASAARRSQQPESLSVPVHRKFPPQVENVDVAGSKCKHNSGALPSSPLGSRSRRFQSRIHERQELLQWLRDSTEKACQQSATAQDNRRSQPPRQKEVGPEACPWEKTPEPAPCPYRLLDHGHDCAQWSPQCERRPHRRSKSHGEGGGAAPCSGTHHHYRHRERDLERQRAMRQVASWIQREHLASMDCSRGTRPERHEHHHLHEHVHHHYHHYVD
ncbi:protein naked cuticle homolog 1 isoform X2 [Ixodes scapularis]|uniref:protein naked cuticle homolog 1 isoform X2 n=1 Tax=Ixodes scapularis TaxID=6945 RepID=UPI001A9DB3AC|nr:protein naked cuticle homolog 1 isoform X2 [Ixodes scapularis]